MRYFTFTGDKGEDIYEGDVPAHLLDEAKTLRDKMIEAVAETDDALLEKYLAGEVPTIEELAAAIRRGTIERKFFPIFCGSALKNKGVQLILDAVHDYLPSPLDIEPQTAMDPRTDEKAVRAPDIERPLCGAGFQSDQRPDRHGQAGVLSRLLWHGQSGRYDPELHQRPPGSHVAHVSDACQQA